MNKNHRLETIYSNSLYLKKKHLTSNLQKATLRKFIRKFENRVKTSQIVNLQNNDSTSILTPLYPTSTSFAFLSNGWTTGADNGSVSPPKGGETTPLAGALWGKGDSGAWQKFNLTALNTSKQKKNVSTLDSLDEKEITLAFAFAKAKVKDDNPSLRSEASPPSSLEEKALKKQRTNISRKDLQILQYRSLLTSSSSNGLLPDISKEKRGASSLSSTNNKVEQKQNQIYDSLMLLHPLKFYVQQEAAFKRKLRYYSPNIFRKFSVENNAPYFRVMMKRYFYNYKPNLRWERTLKAASLRKARRKTTRIPKQLQKADYSSSSNVVSMRPASSLPGGGLSSGFDNKGSIIENKEQEPIYVDKIITPLEKAAFQKSTYNYSVVSKRATRYRYQIYKDVLQHWYYSPFNRFLLKLDVDSFIRRQPNAHFLTAKEENLLHLRRFLLSEHYNTLRWYTNMEHYRSMKTQLNSGVKSFSSRAYNQQFSGTFKKVRHLFATTPSIAGSTVGASGDLASHAASISTASSSPFTSLSRSGLISSLAKQSRGEGKGEKELLIGKEPKEEQKLVNVLKFDQPLYNEYNEYPNNGVLPNPQTEGKGEANPLLNPLIIHEELLPEFYGTSTSLRGLPQGEELASTEASPPLQKILNNDLLTQSQNIVRQYLIQTRSVRDEYIKQLLKENNYSELTQFIYKGQKIRGNEPITNQRLLNNQEKNYLLTAAEKAEIEISPFTQGGNDAFSRSFIASRSPGAPTGAPALAGGFGALPAGGAPPRLR